MSLSTFFHFVVFTGCVPTPTLVAKALRSRTASRRAIIFPTFLAVLCSSAWAFAFADAALFGAAFPLAFARATPVVRRPFGGIGGRTQERVERSLWETDRTTSERNDVESQNLRRMGGAA